MDSKASKMAQRMKIPAARAESLSSIPRKNMVEDENQFSKAVLWPPYVNHDMHLLSSK